MNTLISVGLDTGYGAVKATAIKEDRSSFKCSFESLVAEVISAAQKDDSGVLKRWQNQDGTKWFQANGGVAAQGYRSASTRYFQTAEYRSLTKIMIGVVAEEANAKTIETLVLGLPLNQYETQENRNLLIETFQGDQQVFYGGEQRSIQVKKVVVVPQPVGALADFTNPKEGAFAPPVEICVLDVGNGTTDFIVCSNLRMNKDASRSINCAMGELRSDLARTLAKNDFYDMTSEKLNALLSGRPTYSEGKALKRKDIQQYLDQSTTRLVKRILNELPLIENTTLLITGAAAGLLLPTFKRELPLSVDIKISNDPAFSNSTGFALIGLKK
jgi:PRTRC genetic system protein D